MTIPILYLIAGLSVSALVLFLALPKSRADSSPGDIDVVRLISAIRAVEGARLDYIGTSGERGIYQLTEGVWKDNSHLPFEYASGDDPVCVMETNRVVLKHLRWIFENIRKAGSQPTVYSVALIYHGGLARWQRVENRWVDTSYAQRVEAVYKDAE